MHAFIAVLVLLLMCGGLHRARKAGITSTRGTRKQRLSIPRTCTLGYAPTSERGYPSMKPPIEQADDSLLELGVHWAS